MDFCDRQKRRESNVNAIVHARGWSGLFNGFGGKDASKKLEPADLLPFPFELKNENRVISQKTIDVLIRLISEGKLPPKVVSAAQQLQEIQEHFGLN